MQMTEVRDKLQSLQEVLSEKYDIEKQVAEAPRQLSVQDELLARLKKEYLEKNDIYEECKKKVADLESELRAAEKSREEGEKGMDNIATHREYEALDKQITEATAKEAEVRKELDKEKKNLSDLNENLKIDESMIKSQETDLNAQKASLEKQMSKLKNQLEKLAAKEAEITKDIDTEIVYKFQRIIQRNRQGIVAVKNGVCEGCHMILPAQFANEVREGDKTLFCPYCSRILFYQESDENEDDYYAMAEAGSLSDYEDDFEDEAADEDSGNYSEDDSYADDSSDYESDSSDSEDEDDEKDDSDGESDEND